MTAPTRKPSIVALIRDHAEELRRLDYIGLRAWTRRHGLDQYNTRSACTRGLNAIGIDHAALMAEKLETEPNHALFLYSAASVDPNHFAICSHKGPSVWYARMARQYGDHHGNQDEADLIAAKKTVWLATQVEDAIGAPVALVSISSAEWIIPGKYFFGPPDDLEMGLAPFLLNRHLCDIHHHARRLAVFLHMEYVPERENPAIPYTLIRGSEDWRDADLRALAVPLEDLPDP